MTAQIPFARSTLLRNLQLRTFANSTRAQNPMGKNPAANQPDSNAKDVQKDTPNTDPQSTASKDERKSGDDHPAKQPDYQATPQSTTGVGGKSEVKSGKEGLGARSGKT